MRALLIVVACASCACATTGATPRPFPLPASAKTGASTARPAASTAPGKETAPAAARAGGYEISGTALSLRGTRYRSGGADPNGFDCSGLVRYVFAQHGYSLPRRVADQFAAGGAVQSSDLLPGDLVFFSTTSEGPSHVGIMVGGDSFVHAPASSGVVRVDTLGAQYWSSRFLGAKRVVRQ